jgi:prepilin-type processing-associated H-X9-DG protein
MEAAIHPWINDWYRYGFERNGVPMPVDPSTKRWGENIVLRHNETMNVVYADGHVKAAKPFSTPEVYNVDQR